MMTRFRTRQRTTAMVALLTMAAGACDGDGSTGTGPAGPVPVAAVEVDPATHSLHVGETVALSATVKDAQGHVLTDRAVTWISSDAQIAAVTVDGHVAAAHTGVAHVIATSEGKKDTAVVTVLPVMVASVAVSPTTVSLDEGATTTLAAVTKDAVGHDLTDRPITWSSANPAVADVSSAGQVTAKVAGTVRIDATSEGKTGSATVTVTAPAVSGVWLTRDRDVIEVLDTTVWVATPHDAANRALTGRAVTWRSGNTAVATVTEQGQVIGRSAGTAMITAISEGKSESALITVNARPVADLVYQRLAPDTSQIWTVSLATPGAASQYVNAGSVSRRPAPRFDGQRIAFAVRMQPSAQETVEDIYAVDRDGLNMQRLTTEPGLDDEPAYSPDGARIAYAHETQATGRRDIWAMDADGANKVNLTADQAIEETRGDPAWSPDGQWIAYYSFANSPGTQAGSIWIMRADGTEKRMLTTAEGHDNSPSWSPDGRRVAFQRAGDIAIVTVASGEVTKLGIAGGQLSPAWSPDGEHFAFVMRDPLDQFGRYQIWTVRADGTDLRLRVDDKTTPSGGGVFEPRWIRRANPATLVRKNR